MNQESKVKNLKIFLRVYGVLTLLVMSINSMGFLFRITDFNPGGKFHWLIWDDIDGHVGPMIFVVYMVWGAFFFLAANKPREYRSFLDFTMWANLAHGLLMIPMALEGSHMYHSKFLTDIPFILGLSAGIYLLRPKSTEKEAASVKVEA